MDERKQNKFVRDQFNKYSLIKKAERDGNKNTEPHSTASTSQQSIYQKAAQEAMKKNLNIQTTVEPFKSDRQKKKERKIEKSKWNWGVGKWSSMRMLEPTEEDKRGLALLSMRASINPARQYRRNDLKSPKFYRIATMMDDPYSRVKVPKKKTMLDDLMSDEQFCKQLDRDYQQIKLLKSKRHAGPKGRAHRKNKRRK